MGGRFQWLEPKRQQPAPYKPPATVAFTRSGRSYLRVLR